MCILRSVCRGRCVSCLLWLPDRSQGFLCMLSDLGRRGFQACCYLFVGVAAIEGHEQGAAARFVHRCDGAHHDVRCGMRSEEHTSELQSLMRISYAVICLKKKITFNIHIICIFKMMIASYII